MSKYFSIDVATAHDVIYAYCGDDKQNSLAGPLPVDNQAIARIQLPASVGDDQLDDVLTNMFVPVALRNTGRRVLIRVADDKVVTAWVVNLPA